MDHSGVVLQLSFQQSYHPIVYSSDKKESKENLDLNKKYIKRKEMQDNCKNILFSHEGYFPQTIIIFTYSIYGS